MNAQYASRGYFHVTYQRMTVPSKTLQQLWQWLAPLRAVDLLVVDAEGAEHLVLGPPLPAPKPSLIFFEVSAYTNSSVHDEKGPETLATLEASLRAQGYSKVRWDQDGSYTGKMPKNGTGDDLWALHGAGKRRHALQNSRVNGNWLPKLPDEKCE